MDGGLSGAPIVHCDDFDGPLDLLLALARAQKIDLGRIAIADLVDPFVAAIAAPARTAPLAQLGDWLVTASWLTLLKSRLLLPAGAPEAVQAQQDAARLRDRLADAAQVRALAFWLEARPQRGLDFFVRGGPHAPVPAAGDLLDLLLACFAVYEAPAAAAAPVYRPGRRADLCTVAQALARLRQLLAAHPEGGELALFLPPHEGSEKPSPLRARSALASTFLAGLEMAREETLLMAQAEAFGNIHLRAVPADS
jgi:segregation and condensation protein A